MRLRAALLLLALTSAVAGCAEMKELSQEIPAMQELQRGIVTTFNEPVVEINISNQTMIVTFVNSKLAAVPESDRAATCQRVAEYVRDHFPFYSRLSEVRVGFKSVASVGIASATKTEIPYLYSTSDLGPAPATAVRDSNSGAAPVPPHS